MAASTISSRLRGGLGKVAKAIKAERRFNGAPGFRLKLRIARSFGNARAYIKKIEEVVGVPVDIISTGPDRNETIVLRHPFA